MEHIIKIIKSLEESGLLITKIIETIKNETKEQKQGFLPMQLGTLAASLFGNALTGKGNALTGKGVIIAGEGVIKAGENFNATPIL